MKSLKKMSEEMRSSPAMGAYITVQECPKCGAKLYHEMSVALTIYSCKKCGYMGPVALNPLEKDSKKRFNDAVRDMKTFMKSSKKK
jgi:predicted RNA-binding Zn-ribbon protein involved in translation (DUF1610 family)